MGSPIWFLVSFDHYHETANTLLVLLETFQSLNLFLVHTLAKPAFQPSTIEEGELAYLD